MELVPDYLVGVSKVRFAIMALAHRNMWFGKRKDKRVEDNDLSVLGAMWWSPRYAAAAAPNVTKNKSYQWNLEMDPTPGKLVH